MRSVCRAVNKYSVVHAVFDVYKVTRVSRDSAKCVEAPQQLLVLRKFCNAVGGA